MTALGVIETLKLMLWYCMDAKEVWDVFRDLNVRVNLLALFIDLEDMLLGVDLDLVPVKEEEDRHEDELIYKNILRSNSPILVWDILGLANIVWTSSKRETLW